MERKTILTRLACWILSICIVFQGLSLRSLAAENKQAMDAGPYTDTGRAGALSEEDKTPEPEVKARNSGFKPKQTRIEIKTVENAYLEIWYKEGGSYWTDIKVRVTEKNGIYKTNIEPALEIGAKLEVKVREDGKSPFTKIIKVFEDRDSNGVDDTTEVTYLEPVVARNIGVDGQRPEFTTIEGSAKRSTRILVTFTEEGKDKPTQINTRGNISDKFKLVLKDEESGENILLKPGSEVLVEAKYYRKEASYQRTKVFEDLNDDKIPDEKTEKPTGKAVNFGQDPKATTITGSAEPGARVEVKLGESLLGQTEASDNGTYSLEVTKDGQALEEGVEIDIYAQGEIKAISDPLKIMVEVDPGEVKLRLVYLDEFNNPIYSKYRLKGENYPEEITAKENELEELLANGKAPKFLSYRIEEARLEPNKDDQETSKTIKYTYKKLPDIIPEDQADEGVKANYTPVTLKANSDKGKLKLGDFDGGSQKLYYVNPVEEKTLTDIINEYKISAEGKKDIYKLDESRHWNISPDQVDLTSIVDKEAIDLEANFVKEKALVTYEFASTREDKALPNEGMPDKPEGKYYEVQSKVTAQNKSYDPVPVKEEINGREVLVGSWIFKGWTIGGDKVESLIVSKAVPNKVTGLWEYKEASKTPIAYKFVSATEDKDLPSEGLPETPKTIDTYIGEVIESPSTSYKDVPVKESIDGKEILVGRWTFTGWSPQAIEVKDQEAKDFVGTWTFVEEDKKDVDFSFKFYNSKKPNEEIQESILKDKFEPTVPDRQMGKYVGIDIILPSFEDKLVNTGDLQGRWKFDGWYRGDSKITGGDAKVSANEAENKLVGKWILNETKTAMVRRKFIIEPSIIGDGKDLPKGHSLPDAVKVTQKINDTTNYIGSIQTPGKDKFTAIAETINGKQGIWTFVKWDKDELTVSEVERDNVFTGIWTWEQEKSREPEVKTAKEGDNTITGKGVPGSKIEIIIPGVDEVIETIVDENGNWMVDLPEDKGLREKDKIKVSQTENGKKINSIEVIAEKDKAVMKELRVNFEIKPSDSDKGEFVKNEGGGVNKTLVLPKTFDAAKLRAQSPEVRGINGYEFIGWDKAFEGDLTEDTIYYALFKKLSKPEPGPEPSPDSRPEPQPEPRPEQIPQERPELNIKPSQSPSIPMPEANPLKHRKVDRILGENRIETSINLSQKYYKRADTVVIADAGGYPDALSASSLAKALNAPILLSNSEDLNEAVKAEIQRLEPKNVVIIGGENSISKEVEEKLGKATGLSLQRISGDDRYETSARVAREIVERTGAVDKAVIASGEVFADALAVAPLAAKETAPILLVKKDEAPGVILETIKDLKIKPVYIAGGYKTVDKALEEKLPQVIERFAGQNRYETAGLIAKHTYKDATEAFVASGENWPDALVIGPIAAKVKAPILLIGKDGSKETKKYMEESKVKGLVIVGGEDMISKEAVEAFK